MAELSHDVTTPDGRRLSCLEVGEPSGPLVLHNHGGPSSRLEARLFADVAARHRLRFVCVDRPGMGQSSPHRGRGFADWAADLITVADALGGEQFGVTGWSEGGPWALAAAAYLDPNRLRHVTSIAGGSYGAFGDNWAAEQLSRADAFGGLLALRFPPGFRLMYASIALAAKHFRNTFAKKLNDSVNDYDRRVLAEAGVSDALLDAFAECFAHGSGGLVDDATLLYRHWAFDVATIARPVHMWQGTEDLLVPACVNDRVSEQLPGAISHHIQGAGHFIALGNADDVFGIVANELGS